jgi:type IV pilus assembly protein PilM
MDFLPKALGTRPRLAVEVRTEGVVAARAEDAAGLLTAVARRSLAVRSLLPGSKAGNVVDRSEMITAVRTALDAVAGRGAGGSRTRDVTVVVPDAAVRVLLLDFDALPSKAAEALPVVRFRLKKLLPFEVEDAVVSYQVMSSAKGLVTVLAVAIPRDVLAEYEGVVTAAGYVTGAVLPSTLAALAALGVENGAGEGPASAALVVNAGAGQVTTAIVRGGVLLLHRTLELEVEAETNAVAEATPLQGTGYYAAAAEVSQRAERLAESLSEVKTVLMGREVAQAVSVAAAYFEDTLSSSPEVLLAAGTTGAAALEEMLHANGLEGLRVREMMEPGMMEADAATASVPRGWLTGVKGALTS